MPGRSYSNVSEYRYGFNGKENDNEVKGEGNQQDYGMRIYDPRLGRFLSVDPMSKSYPYLTPYQFASNSPIGGIDLDGLEFFKKDNTQYTMDYKPVANAPGVLAKADNVAHNAMAFIWNVTIGGGAEGVKSVNNYFAGGYKEPTTNVVASFNQFQTEAAKYHTTTPIKQQLKDFGSVATDLRNYELPAQLLIAHKLAAPTTSSPILSSGEIIGARRTLANSFYEKAGFSPANALQHMEGINFENAVQITTLKKGAIIQQWVGERGVGNYFTTLENGAARNLGIPNYDTRVLKQFTLTEDVKVLKSTAADYKGNAGGGTQFFNPELKSKTVPKE